MVRQLWADGRNLADAGSVMVAWGIPEGVRQVIGKRLAGLSPDANRLLQAAATLGDGCSFDALTSVSEMEWAQATDALEAALRAGILREEAEGYHFTHALIRQSVYEALSLPRRQRFHQQAAEAIETIHARNITPHLGQLARHWFHAGTDDARARAVGYATQAAGHAMTLLAYEEAARHYERALQAVERAEPVDAAQRCDLLLLLGEAQRRAGDTQRARDTFQRAADSARHAHLPDQLARAALGLGARGETEIGTVDATLVGLLEESLEALGPAETALRSRVLAGLARALYYTEAHERRAVLSGEALDLARRLGDRGALAHPLACRHYAMWGPDRTEERLALAGELVELAGETGDRELALQGRHWRLIDLLELGDIRSVDAELDAYARLAAELRQPLYLWYSGVLQAMRALLAGRFDEGERLALQARKMGRRMRNPNADLNYAVFTFALCQERGRLDEMVTAVERLVERYPALPAFRCALAGIYCETGRADEARRLFEEMIPSTVTDGAPGADAVTLPRDTHWLLSIAFLAEVCVALGDTRRAGMLYRLLLPYARRNVLIGAGVTCHGSVARHLGLLAALQSRREQAAQHFEDALAMHTRMGAKPLLAHTQRAYGAMLLSCGKRADLPRARELLGGAQALYAELQLEHRVAETRALLPGARSPARPAVRPAPYPGGLSRREVEVLCLIAAGKSNREIADELVISFNTAIHHVSNILVKTGAANRAEAAAFAARHGLVS